MKDHTGQESTAGWVAWKVKTAENARVRETVRRTESLVEFKLRNVSAVMRDLHLYRVEGCKPAKNCQRALRDAVVHHLETDPTIEVAFSAEEADRSNLYQVFDFGKSSGSDERHDLGLYVLPGSLEHTCSLRPEVYQGLPR